MLTAVCACIRCLICKKVSAGTCGNLSTAIHSFAVDCLNVARVYNERRAFHIHVRDNGCCVRAASTSALLRKPLQTYSKRLHCWLTALNLAEHNLAVALLASLFRSATCDLPCALCMAYPRVAWTQKQTKRSKHYVMSALNHSDHNVSVTLLPFQLWQHTGGLCARRGGPCVAAVFGQNMLFVLCAIVLQVRPTTNVLLKCPLYLFVCPQNIICFCVRRICRPRVHNNMCVCVRRRYLL